MHVFAFERDEQELRCGLNQSSFWLEPRGSSIFRSSVQRKPWQEHDLQLGQVRLTFNHLMESRARNPIPPKIQRSSLLQLVGFSFWLESNKQLYGSPRAHPKRLKIKKMGWDASKGADRWCATWRPNSKTLQTKFDIWISDVISQYQSKRTITNKYLKLTN